ncbi:hypothetical protein A5731_00870 [Mycolicibacterium conceptionense]|uniref:(S)-ureidoglycine aminohydrolase cupin domain-containing protein n=1 Tax=Mycolicibacterium conceptionense TaxID=451644 RepID=A0A1A2V0Z9_9MYCO|nr:MULTISPECIES: cupin domain-containing protein [Mycolicibacterium]MCW1824422.1 cupin domain-containing protein [Mycolicibacterium senegalense]OBB10896.1 hypothetical protein A5718_07355 [Mycolicibacterium conceptionense]OBF03294.1 hypothetical protein A5731_00870 [Mycolicibacterium conceptionense]OBF24537.1 hypothetical protein A5726_09380 [Mycolicibacterium conceptionense]OBF32641.1 hypothetical protein A5720_26220 [Mycolicibacterium conceptionense]
MSAIKRFDPITLPLFESDRPGSTAPVRSARVFSDGGQAHGVWEAEPGVHMDYRGQETVVILSGRATVKGESGDTVEVGPGDLVVVDPGEGTTWTVHETIRKVFVVNH